MSLMSKDGSLDPLCSKTPLRCHYNDGHKGLHELASVYFIMLGLWERRWLTCEEKQLRGREEVEFEGDGGKGWRQVDTEQTGHRAHHCTAHKPPMTGHGRLGARTHSDAHISCEGSLTRAHALSLTHVHTHSAAFSTKHQLLYCSVTFSPLSVFLSRLSWLS